MWPELDARTIRGWAEESVARLDAHREELDRANVFPVADGDTGTNLVATLRAAADAVRAERDDAGPGAVAAALARGALRGARGNSGVILSQLPRGLAEALAVPDRAGPGPGDGDRAGPEPAGGSAGDGMVLATALRRADELARSAVSRPVEGTVLTVLSAAARSAAEAAGRGGELGGVALAAVDGASRALADTPRLLPVLARAGVVDAGGRGLLLLLEALVEVVSGRPGGWTAGGSTGGPATPPGAGSSCTDLGGRHLAAGADRGGLAVRDVTTLTAAREPGSAGYGYEVMYLLDGLPGGVPIAALRAELDSVGDSVAVVGGPAVEGDPTAVWRVHVHCDDVGAAIEAGVRAGRPHGITVVRFADQPVAGGVAGRDETGRFRRERAVVTVVGGRAVAELVGGPGVTALVAAPGRVPGAGELAAAVAGSRARHVVLLPNDPGLTPVADEAADEARAAGIEVEVVPTSSVVQGLAALAVHDPARRAGDDVVAMAEAAAATRTGALQVAREEALTWAGRCQAGDVLGLVDGEVVLIDDRLGTAACRLVDRMLAAGGELVTVVLEGSAPGPGPDELDALGAGLAAYLRRTHPEVQVVRYRGGAAGRPLQLGVE